jgi:hypothetical protein
MATSSKSTMLAQIAVGVALVVLASVIHGLFMLFGVRSLYKHFVQGEAIQNEEVRVMLVSVFTAWMFLGMILQALLWAVSSMWNPAITELPDLESALYFSVVKFTTLGYGDLVLTDSGRILSAI